MEFEPRPSTHETSLPIESMEFTIDQHPEWRDIWQSWPEPVREYLAPIIEAKRLTPELYHDLEMTLEVAEQDRKMTQFGMTDRNTAAEVIHQKGQPAILRVYPELSNMVKRRIEKGEDGMSVAAHIMSHEFGHRAERFISPLHYYELIKNRVSWSNSKYIQEVGQAAQEHMLGEMLADDIGIYLRLRESDVDSAALELVEARLERALTPEERDTYNADAYSADYQELIEEAKALISFFNESLAEAGRQRAKEGNFEAMWLSLHEAGQEAAQESDIDTQGGYIHEVPPEAELPLSLRPKGKKADWMERLFFAGGTRESVGASAPH